MEDVPTNTHFRFSGIISLNSLGLTPSAQLSLSVDLDEQSYTYLLLRKGSRADQLEAKLPGFINKYLSGEIKRKTSFQLGLQPVTSIHLYSHLEGEMSANGDINYVYALLMTAALILLIASINYMNLATARSSRRAKEVGIRKVVGSRRSQLIGQFLTESVVLALMAFVVGIVGASLLLPFFNQLIGKQLTMDALSESSIGWWLAIIAIFCGLISGSYPALLLSGFKPSVVLKGSWTSVAQGVLLRKGLVVFQFVVSIALIAATWVVYQQLRYVNTTQLGFDKEQIVTLRVNGETRGKLAEVKTQLLRNPGIVGVAAASNPLGIDENVSKGTLFFETNSRVISTQSQFTQRLSVDYDFLDVMRIRLKEGRNFLPTMATDAQQAVLVNEALVKSQGWQQPVGKRVAYFADDAGNKAEAVVIGVVKNFHLVSLHQVIEPMVFSLIPPQESDNLFVRISPKNIPSTLDYLKQTYRTFDPNNPFEAHFLDENFARQYETDTKQARIIMTFSILTTLIACLGLFGLAAFMAEQRTKEIGIRKVLGASVSNIVTLLSKDFLRLVLLANIIAWPLAYYAMNRWLQDFAYRIEIGWSVFALSGTAALLIALLTVSYQAIKAAIANPVDSLRTE
jgi:putative ABC transport system permease protein